MIRSQVEMHQGTSLTRTIDTNKLETVVKQRLTGRQSSAPLCGWLWHSLRPSLGLCTCVIITDSQMNA